MMKKSEEAGYREEAGGGYGAPPAYSSAPQAGPAPPPVGVSSRILNQCFGSVLYPHGSVLK